MVFFGSFLVAHKQISYGAVLDALDRQLKLRVPLGRFARMKAVMSDEQVLDVLNEQATTGEPFGQTARRLSYLDENQLECLLDVQAGERAALGEVLVDMKALKREAMEGSLREFLGHEHLVLPE